MRRLSFRAGRTERRSSVSRWLAAGLIVAGLLVPAVASAQVEIVAGEESITIGGEVKSERAIRITLSGEVRFDFVYRNDTYFDAALGDAVTGAPGAPLGWDATTAGGNDGDSFFMPYFLLAIDVQLAEGVRTMLSLETPFNNFGDNVGGTTGSEGRDVEIGDAYIEWMGAFVPELTLVAGIQNYRLDFAGNGNPFLVDIGRAESAFANPNAGADFGTPQSSSSGSPGSLEAAGVLGEVQLGDVEVDLFYFTLEETFRADEDDSMFGATADYIFETEDWNGSIGVVMYDLQNNPSSSVWTYGGGGHLESAGGDLRVYGEAYGQFGRYLNNLSGFGRISQNRSWAAFGGVRFSPGGFGDVRPWIDASYWELSGDDNGNDDENGNWVSLEGNNDTLIVEDSYYGLDIDTNYRAVKFRGGMNVTDDWSFEVLYGYFELQDNSNETASNGTSSDKIGDEIDLTLHYRATDYLNFRLGAGWLLDPVALGTKSAIQVSVLSAEVRF